MQFFTIGVYNSTEEEFFNKLPDNRVDTFCDIRQRRVMRGPKYAFANSNRLQQKLADLGINYRYVQGLAPTAEIRAVQKQADAEKGESANERRGLEDAFVSEYTNKILNNFDFEDLFAALKSEGAQRIVLFCVEEVAVACHRSIVANELQQKYGCSVTHL